MSEKASGELSVRQLIALVKNALSGKADKSEIPAAVTEQTVSGWGFTKNSGTYSKPSGGIPASDLAAGVIPTVPTKVSDLTNDSGYQTAQQVQTAIASAAELPSGGSAGDFLRKTASGVAWQTVPSAESASFGGGST